MKLDRKHTRSILFGATALVSVLTLSVGPAASQERQVAFDLPAQPLDAALRAFASQAQEQVIFTDADTVGRKVPGLKGSYSADKALQVLLAGTDLEVRRTSKGVLTIAAVANPQSESAAGGGAEVEALIVTAQKREEDIQDVPIAISAFTQEDLTRSQVAGGPDLMTQVPNMTFTKTNFTSYSIQIRGIGTQAISATIDPAVAVAFNNTPFIRNRFFEQEFFDVRRVEVLRGPQGTLYGRNATAGVVNLISAKPTHLFEAKLSGDIANYNSHRLEGMLNIPLVEDRVALRLAGAWTKREGYSTNQLTGDPIDGRNLWSGRATLSLEPNERFRANLIYEHFEENDDRLRSGKQLCKKDLGLQEIGGVPVSQNGGGVFGTQSYTSQGCLPASLYADESFQTPNGFALPYYGPTYNLGNNVRDDVDPYASGVQSRDLRVIESTRNPEYKARTDTAQLQANFDISSSLTLASETAYSSDFVFSVQDYNRFNTKPGAFTYNPTTSARRNLLDENGVFCDPQLGCSSRLLLGDLSTAKSRQFSQEFRLSSDYDGRVNFSLGVNFLRYDTEDKYYVFINSLSLFAAQQWGFAAPNYFDVAWVPGVSDNTDCLKRKNGLRPGDPNAFHFITSCVYIDPNPIGNLNDQGHNYFLSKNPYKLISYAAFGEIYYQLKDNLKVTGGVRWTVDKKRAPLIPSWLLATDTYGYPVADVVVQEWREPTGRLTLDWHPSLAFADETMIYASYAHGYKAGGANPPPPAIAGHIASSSEATIQKLLTHPRTFEPEFVNAFEIGAKNALMDGRVTLNASAFYYDYKGYQISQIVNRSAVNLNFDAEVWGAEIEADWRPVENFRLGFKGGYENTRVADGMRAIDLMDRTAGDPNYIVLKPFPTIPSNCIVPVSYAASPETGGTRVDGLTCIELYYENSLPEFAASVPNNGEGIEKELAGNMLPNAPKFTGTLTADYTLPLPNEWLMTLHTDLYYQSEAWTRIFNTEGYDKLKAYTNVNVAAIFNNEASGLQVMAYVKNVFDRDSITGAFLNSDDTGLTTNVFLTEPRLFGMRVTKNWSGSPAWLSNFSARRLQPGERWPLEVEVSGGPARIDAQNALYRPGFVDAFDETAGMPTEPQTQDLDWGDDRGVKLTYALGSRWTLSLGGRRSETNGSGIAMQERQSQGGFGTGDKYLEGPINYGTTTVSDREEHTIVDFLIGRDFGLGASAVSGGLRYANLQSSSQVNLRGVPDYYMAPENVIKYPQTFHRYDSDMAADRGFEGVGPMFSWEGSRHLLDVETVRVDIDWSASGGVLFGKQTADVRRHTETIYDYQLIFPFPSTYVTTTTVDDPVPISRRRSATVPIIGASLGLSYTLERVKVSGGYRWERYFDAIDGGVETRKSYDRTIDGPYFKISVGFGG